jgi:hypothetical protein
MFLEAIPEYGYAPSRVFLMGKERTTMRSVLPGLDVSDDVIGKIAFSYSYHSD